ncbi:hypothetical protein Droror1_Dr00000894 [Drosera rotundifolia]
MPQTEQNEQITASHQFSVSHSRRRLSMPLNLRRHWRRVLPMAPSLHRGLRSDSALEAIAAAAEARTPSLALYNYPPFSGAMSALFARIFHSKLGIPCLVLPFSSVVPLRVDDLAFDGLKRCYFLDFIGPEGFALELSRRTGSEIMCFDHRKPMLKAIPLAEDCPGNVTFQIDLEKSSSRAAYEYFTKELDGNVLDSNTLLDVKDTDRVQLMLKYIEDGDLQRWKMPDIKAFNVGMNEWRSKMNCISNPRWFDQLYNLSAEELIQQGNSCMSSRQDAAKSLLKNIFKLRLGRGFYGQCLGIRADGNSNLSDEIGKMLCSRSVAAGLRPIGAVIYMQRNNLKMCLRSTDDFTDTSEIAKAYGGGGTRSSSSFIIRMDEFNRWLAINSAA